MPSTEGLKRLKGLNQPDSTRPNEGVEGLKRLRVFKDSTFQPSPDGPQVEFKQSASRWLSEFVDDARLLQSAFQARVWARTPDGTYGEEPEWQRDHWPCVRGDEFGPPIQPPAELAKQSKGRRK